VCPRLVERHPRLRVLMVSTYSEIDLVRALGEPHRGEINVSSAVAGRIIDHNQGVPPE
jgi:hypothetical protein